MLVTSPPPRSAWAPCAEPRTIFGACAFIIDAYWVDQKEWIKPRADLQPQDLSQDDLVWLKLNVGNMDPPDRPLEFPLLSDYDAAEIHKLRPSDVPASTRDSATCVACLQTRRNRKQTRPRSLVWGERIRAPKHMPVVEEEAIDHLMNHLHAPMIEDVDPDSRVVDVQEPIECLPASHTLHWRSPWRRGRRPLGVQRRPLCKTRPPTRAKRGPTSGGHLLV